MKHRWMFVVPHYWGAGESEEEARANCRDAGAKMDALMFGPALLYHFTHEAEWGREDDQAFCWVDSWGNVCWEHMELVEKTELNIPGGESNGQ